MDETKKDEPKMEYVRGGSIHAIGTTKIQKTGHWRIFKPIVNEELCKKCNLCCLYCPDACIELTEEAVKINYDYCKGCGICVEECQSDAIAMEREEEKK
jgi:2-oxoacid:acceptor oxidoreductase delta subunit (pyruvate/2-ketoisovalerate family)